MDRSDAPQPARVFARGRPFHSGAACSRRSPRRPASRAEPDLPKARCGQVGASRVQAAGRWPSGPQAVDVLADTRAAVDRSLKPLTAAELNELRRLLYPVTTDHTLGHSFANAKQGRRVTDLLEK